MGFFLFFFFWLAQTSRVSKNARQFRGVTLLHAALHSAYFQCFDAALYPQPCASNIISWLAQFPVPSGPIIEKKEEALFFPPSGVRVLMKTRVTALEFVLRGEEGCPRTCPLLQVSVPQLVSSSSPSAACYKTKL